MENKLTVQKMIQALQNFWADQGCLLMQSYDTEKGAGTMSPYTFLRAIGPEPWNAAYVEPSRRPADEGVEFASGQGWSPMLVRQSWHIAGATV